MISDTEKFYSRLLGKATLPVSIPRDRAVGGVGAQANPLVAGRTEHTVCLELGDIRVGTQIFNALLL